MPYNGSGSFSLAEPDFVPLTTISSVSMNSDLNDIATGLSTCLTTDGQSQMTAQIKGFSGTVTAPGYSFSTDLNTGIYRIAADNIGVAAGGVKILDISSTGVVITGALTPSGQIAAIAGTVSAPGFAFATDLNTGLYLIGADNLGVAANGAKVLDISSTGLDVTGSATISNGLTVTAGSVSLPAGVINAAELNSDVFATQADQETGTSVATAVSPGRQQYHPSAGKAWAFITNNGSATIAAGYGIASAVRNSTGIVTITFATAFSSANYCVVGTCSDPTAIYAVSTRSPTTTTLVVDTFNTASGALTDRNFSLLVFGDQ